jgi:hypothetical protein
VMCEALERGMSVPNPEVGLLADGYQPHYGYRCAWVPLRALCKVRVPASLPGPCSRPNATGSTGLEALLHAKHVHGLAMAETPERCTRLYAKLIGCACGLFLRAAAPAAAVIHGCRVDRAVSMSPGALALLDADDRLCLLAAGTSAEEDSGGWAAFSWGARRGAADMAASFKQRYPARPIIR